MKATTSPFRRAFEREAEWQSAQRKRVADLLRKKQIRDWSKAQPVRLPYRDD